VKIDMINLFGRDRERPTADTADDRLSLVLSYQRTEIDEKKLKHFRARLIELCDEFGYDVVGQVEIRPQTGRDRTTVICASIPIRRRDTVREPL
jgi:cell division topological specificity factor